MAQGVLDVIKTTFWSFIPRRGSGRREPPRRSGATSSARRSSAPAHGEPLTPEELTALFAETRPEAIEDDARRRRRAARASWRGTR